MPSLKLSVVASALGSDPRKCASLSRQAGFAGLLFDAYGPSLRMPDLSMTGRREFLRVLAGENQQLAGLAGDIGSKGFGLGADVDRLISGLDGAMEAARGLASPLVCVDVGALPEPQKLAKPRPPVTKSQAGLILLPESMMETSDEPEGSGPPPDPKFVSQVDGALSELGGRADRYGVVVAFRSDLASFAAIEAALGRARCPWFGVDLDPVAVLRDEWSRDEVFSRLGHLVRHVRGKDASKGAHRRTKSTVMGKGDAEWHEWIAALDDAGYIGWVTIDPVELTDRAAGATAGLSLLRGLLDP